jgi:putative ABC transport system substrate-binding protein
MKRREFIALIGGAVASPLVARAQQGERRRRVGVLMNVGESDAEGQARLSAFVQRLKELGWIDGRNVTLEIRWGEGNDERYRQYASDLVAHAPDVILAVTSPVVVALQRVSKTVPIVFVSVIDPVGGGLVASMPRPSRNTTGFALFEYAIAAKWLQMLQEMVPAVSRAAVLRDPTIAAGIGQFAAIQAVGPTVTDLSVIDLHDTSGIERAVAEFARASNGGLVVTASAFGANHPDLIVALAARYKLPAIYPFRYFVAAGGLMSYGPEFINQSVQAAGYVDRILKGESPSDLPVQAASKYELVINLKTAKSLGLTVPPSLLARADEVIE